MRAGVSAMFFLTILGGCARGPAPESAPACLPEPAPVPLAERDVPYGMTWFHTIDDEAKTRSMLATLAEMGARKPLALIYWWRWDTKGFDYAAHNYRPQDMDDAYRRALDYYVDISLELGLQPCFRLGSFRSFKGLYHPADPSGSVEPYAAWLKELAARYRGKVYLWMLGDEENRGYPEFGWTGRPEEYLERFFIPSATAVREGDPGTLISTGSVSSAPATHWILQVIERGLPQYADGVSGNFAYPVVESRQEMEDLVRRVRAVWPGCRFFGHTGYAENLHGIRDARQAGITAQCMFTCWDLGWDTAAYYLYVFSKTADTRQNYGVLKSFGEAGEPAEVSDAWKAFQTIANTFYNRSALDSPGVVARLRQADRFVAGDGFAFSLAPDSPVLRTFVREGRQLLIYLACPQFNEPRDGCWDVVIEGREWGEPRRIPLLDYTAREPVPHRWENGTLVLEEVRAGLEPAILTLRRAR